MQDKKIYKVGGYVRDYLINKIHKTSLDPHDIDWVAVGYTPEEFIQMGFKSVGKAFPVFLHPETGEEFALARKEKAIGNKHTDFEFIFTPDISIEEDLARRDFTINSIAEKGYVLGEEKHKIKIFLASANKLIDPFNGIQDIAFKIIEVTNPVHFKEDPLRILRAHRFAVKLGFTLSKRTKLLIKEMLEDNALSFLSKERIYKEFTAGFMYNPVKYIELLQETGTLQCLIPELSLLFDTPEKEEYHSTKNTWQHTAAAIEWLLKTYPDISLKVLLGTLFHDIYKGICQKKNFERKKGEEYIRHDSKEAVEYFNTLANRLNFETNIKNFCKNVIFTHMKAWNIADECVKTTSIYDFIEKITYKFSKDRINDTFDLIKVFKADAISDHTTKNIEKIDAFECLLKKAIKICYSININEISGFMDVSGEQRSQLLKEKRCELIQLYIKPLLKELRNGNYNILKGD